MSSTVYLEKKKFLLESVDTGNRTSKTTDEIKKNEMSADLHKLKLIRKAHFYNLIIGYLNLNSSRSKIHKVRDVFGGLFLDFLYSQKHVPSFPTHSFY